MEMLIESSPMHCFVYEGGTLKVIDKQFNKEFEVAEIMYVPNEKLFMINIDGAFKFSFYLDNETSLWLDGKTDIRIYSE
jgi:hypothetical protein